MCKSFGKLCTGIFLPVFFGYLTLYGSINSFFVLLQRYLQAPSDRLASLILGVATAGLLVTLFMYSVAIVTVASLSFDRKYLGWRYFPVSRKVWRVYAAYLRFLLVWATAIVAYAGVFEIAGRFGFYNSFVFDAGMAVLLLFLVVRCGFLVAPIACGANHGSIIRAAWALSRAAAWQISAILLIGLLIGLGAEVVGEKIILLLMSGQIRASLWAANPLIAAYRSTLAFLLIVQSFACTVTMLLLVPASVSIYRQVLGSRRTA